MSDEITIDEKGKTIKTAETVELEIKEVELNIKKEELKILKNKPTFFLFKSPELLGLFTVAFSILGSYFISNGQLKKGREEFNIQLVENIIDNEIIVTKRKLDFLLSTGILKENKNEIEKSLSKLSIQSSPIYLQKGLKLKEEKDFFSAIEQYDIAIELDSTSIEAYSRRAECHAIIGDQLKSDEFYLKAIFDLKKVIESIDHHSYYFRLSQLYIKLKKYNKSLDYCEFAIQKKPISSAYYDFKGRILLKLSKPSEACIAFKKSIDYDPNWTNQMILKYCEEE